MDIWTCRDGTDLDANRVIGYDVEATDGAIGAIDDLTVDAGAQRFVVDTGFWIFGAKRLLPAGVVDRIDHAERKVYVSLTKSQVKDAPDWTNETKFDNAYRASMDMHFRPASAR